MKLIEANEAWGLLAAFVCAHQRDLTCARPQYARATTAWTSSWADITISKLEYSAFWRWVLQWFPIIIGPRVVLCAACKTVVFMTKKSELLYKLLNYSNEEPCMEFLIYEEDAANFTPQTKQEMHYEDNIFPKPLDNEE